MLQASCCKLYSCILWLEACGQHYQPKGQTATQMPHTLTFLFKCVSPNSLHFSRHLKGSKKTSLSTEISHSSSFIAPAGHLFMHILHLPQRLSSIGSSLHSSGKFVRIETSLSLGPNAFEIKRADLPIQPSPARVATILCDNLVLKSSA